MNNIHFGAGNIGRGFVGLVLSKNGFNLNFVDVQKPLIDALKNKQSYIVEELSKEKTRHEVTYQNVFHAEEDEDAILSSFKDADLITTSLGVSILPKIAPLIARGIQNRIATKTPLYIMACENAINASLILENEVKKHLNEASLTYIQEYVTFLNVAVDRIVPNQTHDDLTFVTVEPYYEWVIESSELNERHDFEGMLFVDDLNAYIERKLFTVNTGHAAIAYLSYHKGISKIHEGLKNHSIKQDALGILEETSQLLIKKHGLDQESQKAYRLKTIERFNNPLLDDDVTRVARNPIRKLSHHDRLIQPFEECINYNIKVPFLTKAIVSALKYDYVKDEEATNLQSRLKEDPRQTIKDVTGLKEEALEMIVQAYLKT